jgi:hypothetical protein
MAKPYTKTIVGYMRHRKFLALNANAIALWHEGKDYCSEHLTDGLIPTEAVRGFRFRGAKAVDLLKSSCGSKPDGTVYAPLWEVHPVGYKMHDYLEHNDSYEVIQARMERADVDRDWDRRRKQLYRDGPLLALIRARDADQCRYCATGSLVRGGRSARRDRSQVPTRVSRDSVATQESTGGVRTSGARGQLQLIRAWGSTASTD